MACKALFGWTVIRNSSGKIVTYKRDCPADVAHFTDDLAPFIFPSEAEAVASGKAGHYAYKR
jgi:hypothetical protein